MDGLRLPDPRNNVIKPGSLESILEVPGEAAASQAFRDVPHAEVRQIWYQSRVLKRARRMHVYTPLGYDASANRFPVFYLLASGDTDAGWTVTGRAGFILDNLPADRKAAPMIVMMPDAATARVAPTQMRAGAGPEDYREGDLFGEALHTDIMPLVEGRYRVRPGPQNRAIAGLSNGGMQVLWYGLPHPETFAYFGIFSSGQSPKGNTALLKVAAPFFADPAKTNKSVKLVWIAYGRTDIANANSQNLSGLLAEKGIRHEAKETPGGHTWINWRAYLYQFAQLLFR